MTKLTPEVRAALNPLPEKAQRVIVEAMGAAAFKQWRRDRACEFAAKLLDERVPRSIVVERIEHRYELKKTIAYRCIELALEVVRKGGQKAESDNSSFAVINRGLA